MNRRQVFYYLPDGQKAHVDVGGKIGKDDLNIAPFGEELVAMLEAAARDGGRLGLMDQPIGNLMREALAGGVDCLLCGRPTLRSHKMPHVAFVLSPEPECAPVMVSALCAPCCDVPDSGTLLDMVWVALQRAQGKPDAARAALRQVMSSHALERAVVKAARNAGANPGKMITTDEVAGLVYGTTLLTESQLDRVSAALHRLQARGVVEGGKRDIH